MPIKARFLSVLIKPDPSHTTNEVEEAMNKSLDWFRLDDNYYVAYSTGSLDQWRSRLLPLAEPGGHFLVAPIDMTQKKGWVTKAFWDWAKKMPEKHPGK
ncbi:hypothetical protein [Paraburkholderia sp. A3RO-2L]|uniref:hypothetical protein n=1 Tax=Paraburkholderia sp. A3RO-2L TaxID=3028376 RepID=UPI003DA949B5